MEVMVDTGAEVVDGFESVEVDGTELSVEDTG